MIARLQQVIVGTAALLAFAWLCILGSHGYLTWAVLGFLLILSCFAGVLAVEFFVLALSSRGTAIEKPTSVALVRAWAREAVTAPLVFLWRQPFRSKAVPDWLPPQAPRRRGVLMVHGLFCNRGFWNPWLTVLRTRGFPCIAVTLEPPFESIDRYGPALTAAADRLKELTGLLPVVVAHSMGGLAVRHWIAAAGPQVPPLHRVFTIGSPHDGTWMARFSFTKNGRQMRRGSDWLADLKSKEAAGAHARFVCYFSDCDNIVLPAESATLPGADNRFLAGQPHVDMAFHPAIKEAVFDELNAIQQFHETS